MQRRDFMHWIGANTLASLLASNALAKTTVESINKKGSMTVGDLHRYLRSLCEVEEPSCDQVIVGDPDSVISKVGTAWMGYWRICREAVKAGANTLVVHEPTFYTHWDLQEKNPRYGRNETSKAAYEQLIARKKAWILEQGLSIIRCHDVLDRVGEFGIPFALGHALGFPKKNIVRSERFYNVYAVPPQPAVKIARHIADRLTPFGQQGVAFYGEEDRRIATVGVGTGCICDPLQFADLNPDLFIAIDDAVRTWEQTVYAEDSGHPLVVINHGTAEEPGMKMLTGHLEKTFPNMAFMHFGDGCGYKWIAPGKT